MTSPKHSSTGLYRIRESIERLISILRSRIKAKAESGALGKLL
jgi:hypothetical protein